MTNTTGLKRKGSALLIAGALWPAGAMAQAPQDCDKVSPLAVVAASDDGSFDAEYGPERVFDNDFDPDSRWSSEGAGKQITLDLGAAQALRAVGLAFYKGDERRTGFDLEASEDGESWTSLIEGGQSGGATTAIERFELPATQAPKTGDRIDYVITPGPGKIFQRAGQIFGIVNPFAVAARGLDDVLVFR